MWRWRERASVRIHTRTHAQIREAHGWIIGVSAGSSGLRASAVPPNLPPDRDRLPRPCDRPGSSGKDEEERREQTGRSAFLLICITHPSIHPSIHLPIHPSNHPAIQPFRSGVVMETSSSSSARWRLKIKGLMKARCSMNEVKMLPSHHPCV